MIIEIIFKIKNILQEFNIIAQIIISQLQIFKNLLLFKI